MLSLHSPPRLFLVLGFAAAVGCASGSSADVAEQPAEPSANATETAAKPVESSELPVASATPAATAPTASASAVASATPAKLPTPAWFGAAKLQHLGDEPLVVTIGGEPVDVPHRRFVWSAPDKAWFLEVHSTLSGLTYLGPMFWFKKSQKPKKGTKLKSSDDAGFSMSIQRTDGTKTGWSGNATSFEIEVLAFDVTKKYDPKGPHTQTLGTGKFRLALSLGGNGSDIPDSWSAGTSDAEIVASGGPVP